MLESINNKALHLSSLQQLILTDLQRYQWIQALYTQAIKPQTLVIFTSIFESNINELR
jgi:hypothetical protein